MDYIISDLMRSFHKLTFFSIFNNFSEIFPKTWSEHISCIKSFTSTCLSTNQRSDFNRAVGDSINSVHKMCTNEDYKSGNILNINEKLFQLELFDPCSLCKKRATSFSHILHGVAS